MLGCYFFRCMKAISWGKGGERRVVRRKAREGVRGMKRKSEMT